MRRLPVLTSVLVAMFAGAFGACGGDAPAEGSGGDASLPPEKPDYVCTVPDRALTKFEALPGLRIRITDVSGGTGPGGNFVVGDRVSVTFTLTTHDGKCPLPLKEVDHLGFWLAGPTSNYQRVLPINTPEAPGNTEYEVGVDDVVANADGSFTFTFPDPIPATYSPPLWDTPKFSDGELTGQPLVDGTYSIATQASRRYLVGAKEVVDPSEDIRHVLFGAATEIQPREVVTVENCNSCHARLERHGGAYRDPRLCVTCHTAGAEDSSSAPTGDPTPVTTEFKVMIHKVHGGRHLPSVLGVATNPDGTRKYDAKPVPYVVGTGLRDFSWVGFPVSPAFRTPMPRDLGYSAAAMTAEQRKLEDQMRMGVTACERCHGDPDGPKGPLKAPAQGQLAFTNPSRRACGSCHDDVDWERPYAANGQVQPPQPNDDACTSCHKPSGDGMAVADAHRHPLVDPKINPGLVFAIQSITEGGTHDSDGRLDPGEKLVVSFTIKDDAGNDVPPSALSNLEIVVSGPVSNRQRLVASTSALLPSLSGTGPVYTTTIPEQVTLELVGTAADDGVVEKFVTSRAPHWTTSPAATDVFERTATTTSSTLAVAAKAVQNFVDVASSTGFARNDFVVLDDDVPDAKEYVQIAFVEGRRLWFTRPLRKPHAAGAAAQKVALAKVASDKLVIKAATGEIAEATPDAIAAGRDVLVSYTTDFVVPSVYPPPINDSPDLDETVGEWAGKSLVAGTYTLGLWGSRSLTVNEAWGSDATTYRATSLAATKDFLVGDATELTRYAFVSSAENCNSCHADIQFHANLRRGFDSCVLCHGTAGAEDRPRYVAANAPATPGVSITFRELVHKLHMGRLLANVASYRVVSAGGGAYPDNFAVSSFENVLFPPKPNGPAQCTRCHGTMNTAWMEPSDRNHPTEQGAPVRAWKTVCGACHDSKAAAAHIEVNTHEGVESCAVCHGVGAEHSVAVSHKSW